MGGDRAEETIEIDASPDAVFAAAHDYDTFPEWQSAVRRCEVLERDTEGRGTLVETVSDAKVRELRYVLRYHYEPVRRIWWAYVEGDVASLEGEYVLEDLGDGRTRLTYRLESDLGIPVPGFLVRRVAKEVMRRSLAELKARAEEPAG
jgi:ribosome-associated toxin RatA of RatAB toxin-antitoxin module